jgi:ADP-sugar diphosphatase
MSSPVKADPAIAASTKVFLNKDQAYTTFTQSDPHELPSYTKFKASLSKFPSSKFTVGPVTPIAVSPFGALGSAKAGFTYAHALVEYNQIADPKGNAVQVPGLALIRGDAVAMLILLKSTADGKEYVVLTEQARVPIGEPNYIEIPAGMTDAASGSAGYAAAIAKEMQEEVGLKLDRTTDFMTIGRMTPSAGGCDERITLYFCRINADPAAISALEGKLGGALEESEQITARIVPIDAVRAKVASGEYDDAKLITALYFYDNNATAKEFVAPSKSLVMKANSSGVEVKTGGGRKSRNNRKQKKQQKKNTRKH